jgi:uncharacterized protein with NAD-binding domain and iron-sulfur cluster
MSTVYILGGGVAGLSAAHELAERGYSVTIFEKNPICGGKARSMPYTGTGSGGRQDLPGEHGFRFFPGFYFHLSDTLSRIWFDQANNIRVLDNLVPATEIGVAQDGKPPFIIPASTPNTLVEWVSALRDVFEAPELGVPLSEVRVFMKKLFCFLGSGPTRRRTDIEKTPWWTYIEAAGKSPEYQCIFGRGLSRSLVAMRPEKGSALTVMSMFVQITLNIIGGKKADRVLNGPTSEVWIEPWVKQLKTDMGVTIHNNAPVQSVTYDPMLKCITGAVVLDSTGAPINVGTKDDIYLAAVPVEVVQKDAVFSHQLKLAAGLIRPASGGEDGISQLQTDWMAGVLFYLNRNAAPLNGHVIYANSPWSLTSISQRQFWDVRKAGMGAYPWSQRGNGAVVDILSSIISAWDEPGIKTVTKKANECTKNEIFQEAWEQLKAHLVLAGNGKLNDSDVVDRFLDPAIAFDEGTGVVSSNEEPLLINTASSRKHRPAAGTDIPNLFVASDYVATNTDLACMEAANEAARQAVNAILTRTGSTQPPCVIQPLREPGVFEFFQTLDETDYALDPSSEPLLCRYIDEILPASSPGLSTSTVAQLLIGITSLAMLAGILYLLLTM